MHGLKLAGVELDRKFSLDEQGFADPAEIAKEGSR